MNFTQFCLKVKPQREKQGLPMDTETLTKLYELSQKLGYVPPQAYGPKGPIIERRARR